MISDFSAADISQIATTSEVQEDDLLLILIAVVDAATIIVVVCPSNLQPRWDRLKWIGELR